MGFPNHFKRHIVLILFTFCTYIYIPQISQDDPTFTVSFYFLKNTVIKRGVQRMRPLGVYGLLMFISLKFTFSKMLFNFNTRPCVQQHDNELSQLS